MACIFISYARQDGMKIAQALAAELGKTHEVFLDSEKIYGGAKWEDVLRNTASQTDMLIVLVTPCAKDSEWMYKEFSIAKETDCTIFPICVNGTKLSPHLKPFNAFELQTNFIHYISWQVEKTLKKRQLELASKENKQAEVALLEQALKDIKRAAEQAKLLERMYTSLRRVVILSVIAVLIALVLSGIVVYFLSQSPEAASSEEPVLISLDPCPYISTRMPLAEVLSNGGQISRPFDCTTNFAQGSTIATGTYNNLNPELKNQLLFLLIHSEGNYWPQEMERCEAEAPIVEMNNGQWRGRINLGGDDHQYDVILAMAETGGEVEQVFREWFATGCKSNEYPPFTAETLPKGLTELDAITVHTR